jgi:hypothetical protein
VGSDETGLRWWIRYALVPLIGGGGLVAVLVAVINRQPPPVARQAVQNSTPPAEKPKPAGPAGVSPAAYRQVR